MAPKTTRFSFGGWLVVIALFGLLIATLVYAVMDYNAVVQLQSQQTGCHGPDSLLCSDGNACTIDYLNPPCFTEWFRWPHQHWNSSVCHTRTCSHLPVADGSCCNRRDFCYEDDPTKECQGGQCVSSNPLLCKGYCASDADCNPTLVPLADDLAFQSSFCTYGACTTLIGANIPIITDPNAFLLENTLAQRNVTSCLNAECVPFSFWSGNYSTTSACIYWWKCSTFTFTRKRALEAEAETPPVLLNFSFGKHIRSGALYNQVAARISAQWFANLGTMAPTAAPTETPTRLPTRSPTGSPTRAPTQTPTSAEPTEAPSPEPSAAPTTASPSEAPTTGEPTAVPTTSAPTLPLPTAEPTVRPTSEGETYAPTAGRRRHQ